ncbi:MAG: AraC family transcriptional regulator [Ruminococcaceae bacterium]|nr:AraC family transcriptional regulator [Oscillospiraceae bacterium]
MERMLLSFFTDDTEFPFHIGYGYHENDDMFMHIHEDFSELVIVLQGKAVHKVEDEKFDIGKGDVFVVGSEVAHGYDDAENFKICNIMFDPKMLTAYDIKKYPGFHSLFVIEPHFIKTQGYQNKLKLGIKEFSALEKLIDTAIKEYETEEPGKKTLVLSYFLQMVVELSRQYTKTETHLSNDKIDGIAYAAAHMEGHYTEDVSMDDLLSLSHYSQRHFIRLFSEAYGVTPHRYLLQLRIKHACALLTETSLSMAEISARCGFNDPNYFARIFKKYISVSPNSYRNNKLKAC